MSAVSPPEEIDAKKVMALRAQTGLPMMKCKEALLATGGDFEKAVEWARKKGLETAAKKADRAMKEGRIAIRRAPDGSVAAMVEVDCETEPVAVGPDFGALVEGAVAAAFDRGPSAADAAGEVPAATLLAQPFGGGPDTVDTAIKQAVARIGENMALRRAAVLTGGGRIGTYLHHNRKRGVLVQVDGPDAALSTVETTALLSELGMHLANGSPLAVSRDQVPSATVEKELEICREQVRQDPKTAGKPAPVLERIVLGKMERFYAERCLLEQPWVKDPDQTVKAVLEATSKKVGGPLSVRRFVVFAVGA